MLWKLFKPHTNFHHSSTDPKHLWKWQLILCYFQVDSCHAFINLLNPAGRFSGLRKWGQTPGRPVVWHLLSSSSWTLFVNYFDIAPSTIFVHFCLSWAISLAFSKVRFSSWSSFWTAPSHIVFGLPLVRLTFWVPSARACFAGASSVSLNRWPIHSSLLFLYLLAMVCQKPEEHLNRLT